MNFYKFTFSLLVFFLSIITMMNYSCAADHHKTKEGPQIDSVENIQQIQTKLAVGAENLAKYIPMIKGKRTALVVNHSSRIIGDKHLVDTLLALDINIVKVFSPEHGFKGNADDGEKIKTCFTVK